MNARTISYSEYKKLKRWYEEQLKSKDKQIEELRKENQAVLKTAISQAHRTKQWEEIVKNFERKKS